MIPRLYPPSAYVFGEGQNGIGALPDAISCVVGATFNGRPELKMTYAKDGIDADKLVPFNIIAVPTNEDNSSLQAFDIAEVTDDGEVIEVYAKHVSYRLDYMPCVNIKSSWISGACNKLTNLGYVAKNTGNYKFTFTYGGVDVSGELNQPSSIPASEMVTCVAKAFDRNVEYNNFKVRFATNESLPRRGGAIRYGHNMRSCTKELNGSTRYNCHANYFYTKDRGLTLGTSHVDTTVLPYPRFYTEDWTQEYEWFPTVSDADAQSEATYNQGKVSTADKMTIESEAVSLWEYDNTGSERLPVECGEIVTVYNPNLNVEYEMQIVATEFNVLTGLVEKFTLGNKITNASEELKSTNVRVTKLERNMSTMYFGGKVSVGGSATLTYVDSGRMEATVTLDALVSIDYAVFNICESTSTEGSSSSVWSKMTKQAIRMQGNKLTLVGAGDSGSFSSGQKVYARYIAVGTSSDYAYDND